MSPLLTLIALGAVALFWADSLRAREHALRRCTAACRQADLQLLDQTVALRRLGLGRGQGGRVHWRRYYGFEFSTNGADRWKGTATLLGLRVEYLHIDHPDGPTILETPSAKHPKVH